MCHIYELDNKEQAVLDRICNDEASANYFFKKVSNVKWFLHLKKAGFFSPENAPSPERAKKESHYTIPEWVVLPYLERIAEQVKKGDCEQGYASELLSIMQEVTYYCQDKEQLNNYRIWWYFTKILCHIPTTHYSVDFLDIITIWLRSRFDNTLIVSELTRGLVPNLLETDYKDSTLKAERLIDIITEIFPSDKTYRFRGDSYWINEFFKKNSILIAKKCSINVLRKLSLKVQKLLELRISSRSIILGDRLFDVELHSLSENYIIVITGKIDDREQKYEISLDKNGEEAFVADLSRFITTTFPGCYKPEIHEKYLWALYNNLYSNGSLQSFYDKDEDHYNHDSLEIMTQILKSLLLEMSKDKHTDIEMLLREYINNNNFTFFTKISLYVIGITGMQFQNTFWEFINSPLSNKIFDSHYVEDELRHVLIKLTSISDNNRDVLLKLIDRGPKYIWTSDGEKDERYIAIWKQERCEALKQFPEFLFRYNELKKLTGWDVSLHPAMGKIETRWGGGESPLTIKEVLSMPNRELADFLQHFKTKDWWKGPTVSALAQTLQSVAKQYPEKFSDDLSPFLGTGFLHIYNFLSGINSAWNENRSVSWGNVLFFLKQYTEKEEFWSDKYTLSDDRDWAANHEWIIRIVCDLIESGTRDDKRAIPAEFNDDINSLLLSFAKRLDNKSEEISNDPLTHVLNSLWGKLLTALLYTALRQARLNKADMRTIRWSVEVKQVFDECFSRQNIDVYIVLGYYLPQFYYLDKEWANERTKFIIAGDQKLRNLFSSGYLHTSTVYADIFKEMEALYRRAIFDLTDESDRKVLANHLATSYFYGFDKNTNATELFFDFVDNGSTSDIHNVIWYFWSKRDADISLKEDRKRRVIDFWRKIYNDAFLAKTIKIDLAKIVPDIVRLAYYLDEINSDAAQWLEAAANFMEEPYGTHSLFEVLDKLKDVGDRIESARYISRIFRKVVIKFVPDYDRDDLRSIFKFLIETDDDEVKDLTKEIFDIYLRCGNELFVDIWESYQN
ncbi:MAG: hypothetical protein LLG02_06655 [Pelosinus sp.]|nr:hypothetical protein [Pelosinus sp.]